MRKTNRFLIQVGIKEFYKVYRKTIKKLPKELYNTYNVDRPTYSAIIKDYNKAVSKLILEEAYEYLIPNRLGVIRIKKYELVLKITDEGKLDKEKTYLPTDWAKTLKMWREFPETKTQGKRVYFLNEHTDGHVYRWYYSKYRSNLVNKSAYSFIPSRDNARSLAALIKSDNKKIDYYL